MAPATTAVGPKRPVASVEAAWTGKKTCRIPAGRVARRPDQATVALASDPTPTDTRPLGAAARVELLGGPERARPGRPDGGMDLERQLGLLAEVLSPSGDVAAALSA